MAESAPQRIPFWKKAVFGTGDIYAGGAQQLVGFLYFFFLTDVVGLRPALAGAVVLVSKIWDAVSDPMFGVLSDRTRTRFGRRRPYFLAGTILIFLSFGGLWLPLEFGTQWGKFIFALTVWLFHETVCSMVLVPFYALGGDLTSDYHERNSIMFSRLFISTLAIILVAVLPKMVVDRFADPRLGYALMGAAFGLLFSLPWIAIFFTFPEKGDYKPDSRLTVFAQTIEPLRIKSFRQLMLLFISGYTAVDLMSGVFVYYMTYYLHRTDFNFVLGALLAGQALLLPIWLRLAKILGKRNALIAGYAWWALMIALMATIAPVWPRAAIYIVAFLMGGGSGAAAFLPWAIFPDVADVSELVYGARRDGASGGFLTFARKCATALGMGLFGLGLDLAGFVKPLTRIVDNVKMSLPQPQPEAALLVIRGALFLVPALLMVFGILVALRFKITAPIQARIRGFLAFRRGESAKGDLPAAEVVHLAQLLAGRGTFAFPDLEAAREAATAATSPQHTAGSSELLPVLTLLIRASLFLILLPYGLQRLAARLAPWLPAFDPGLIGIVAGLALMAAGVYLMARAGMILGVFGKEWPRRPTALLVTKYIYSFTRHPMYLGYSLALLGLGLWQGSAAALALGAAVSLLIFAYAELIEEPALGRKHGDRYRAYRQRVSFLRPRWSALFHGALQVNLVLLTAVIVGRFLFRLLWRVKVEGQENLPEEGPHFLVANHSNLADPFLIGMFLIRPIRFIASDELFRRPFFRALFGLFFGAVKKRRWNRDVGALRQAERWLGQGQVVGIFPEGGRTWDGGPVDVGDEVYRFLHHCRVPVVAAAAIGGHEALPRWAGWPAFARVTIRFFPPIMPDECATVQQLRERIEARIYDGQDEPPVERTFWSSHRGITMVAWACIKCGATRAMSETSDGITCRHCGASWRVTRKLELVDGRTGQVLLERDYHQQVKERLAAGTLQGAGVVWAKVRASRVDQLKLVPYGEGELSLDGKTLRFYNDKHWVTAQIDQVSFAFLNMPGHLVVTDRKETMEYIFLDDSPVRWEDYIAVARKDYVPARKRAEAAKTEVAGK